jgi:hypothetical protein
MSKLVSLSFEGLWHRKTPHMGGTIACVSHNSTGRAVLRPSRSLGCNRLERDRVKFLPACQASGLPLQCQQGSSRAEDIPDATAARIRPNPA